ncbi:MAG: alpha/beta hydrolase, partial [Planctomycetota bacterium]|nr:alpha/beta hydrolase [Planctomycetota bacterium]
MISIRTLAWTARLLVWLPLAIGAFILAGREPNRPARAVPEGAVARFDVVYKNNAGARLRLDVYQPAIADAAARPRPTALIVHGGSWRGGSRVEMTDWAAAFVARGYVAVVPDYSLARPNAPSSDRVLDDLRDAVRWTRDHASEFDSDPQRLVVFGVSSGGHLAALLGLESQRLDPADRVQAVVDLYGPSDLVELLATTPARRDDLQLFF